MIEMLKCREKKKNDNKIKHFYSAAPKKIIWRLSFSLIGDNGSLLHFFVWSPAVCSVFLILQKSSLRIKDFLQKQNISLHVSGHHFSHLKYRPIFKFLQMNHKTYCRY